MKKLAFSFLAVFVAIVLSVSPAFANSGPPWAGTSLDDLTIDLGDPFTNLDTDVTVVSTANNFSDGYLEVAVTGAAASDEFQLVSGGLLTVSGDAVLYNGLRIGTIDNVYNGSNGRLRVNFAASAPLSNSGFETGSLTDWTVDYTDNQMMGQSWAAGPTHGGDGSPTMDDGVVGSITDSAIVQGGTVHGGTFALGMEIDGTVTTNCGTSHSPSIKSSAFAAAAGDNLSVWYNAVPTSDESDVFGFVINSTGGRQTLFHLTGATAGWANVTTPISSAVCASGTCSDLQFEFLNGTYDATCGRAVGSQLFIDDIVLTLAAPPVVTDVMVEAVAENLQYRNTSATPTSPRPYSMNFKDNSTATGDNQANIYILIPPTITTIVPNVGPIAGGTSVVITGTYLTGGTVTFGGLPATCVVNSATQMTCTSPAHAAGAVNVVVTTPDGSATSAGGFIYYNPPTLSGITPTSGPAAGGTDVTINGTYLDTITQVAFGGVNATCHTIVSPNQIICTTGAHAAGLVDLVVTTYGGTVTLPSAYTYIAAPTIATIVPNVGPIAGGTSVVITGTALTGGTVTFGGLPATCTVDSPTQITCTSPAHAAGAVNVVVTTPGGSATSAGGFIYYNPPTLTGITPTSGPAAGGTNVTINGTYLDTITQVAFGGVNATCHTIVSPNQIICTTGAHAAGLVNLVVTTYGGTVTLPSAYTYIAAPTITTIVPNVGPIAGGTSVVITGTALTGGTVTFGGLPATCVVNSATQMTCTSPAHAAGPVNVVVTTPGGEATSAGGFTYIAQSITGIAPNSGPTGGGTSVVISGIGFTGSTGFTFGGTAATCTVDSDTQITCTTPAHAAGLVDVVVTTPTGAATLTNGFTYVPATLTLTATGPATIKPGAQYVYTFNYTLNVKPFNAQVVFTLPGHTTFVSNTGGYTCTPAAGVVTCNLGGITANGSFSATVLVDKLKKVNTPLTLATTAYSISDNGAASVNGAATVTANTLAPFDDVPASYWASDYIQAIWAAGITSGCSASPALYCPAVPITRAQMAVFIERGVHGGSFVPPVVPITFNDTATESARYWIEALKADGITTGCGTGASFCPSQSITRAQMSIFLLRGKYGSAHVPPAATGNVWGDVFVTTWAASWMEQLGNDGISSGCGSGNFCPTSVVNRDRMAALVQRTFNLAMPTP